MTPSFFYKKHVYKEPSTKIYVILQYILLFYFEFKQMGLKRKLLKYFNSPFRDACIHALHALKKNQEDMKMYHFHQSQTSKATLSCPLGSQKMEMT